MSEDFTAESMQFLLGELDEARRRAFEERLNRDPAAAATFKSYADAFARFAIESAPENPGVSGALPHEFPAIVAAISATTSGVRPIKERGHRGLRRTIWPLAAGLLLGFNLWQFYQLHRPEEIRGENAERAKRVLAEQATALRSRPLPAENQPGADNVGGASEKREVEAQLLIAQHRLEKLREDYAALQHSRDTLNAEYDDLLSRLAQMAVTERSGGRLAVMELVDPGSYASGDRKGLLNLFHRTTTDPSITLNGSNIIVGTNTTQGVTATGATAITGIVQGTGSTATAVSSGTPMGASDATGGMSIVAFGPTAVIPTDPAATPNSGSPAQAWAMFDEAGHTGCLNLYNLPLVPPNESLQLWIRTLDGQGYSRVGEVPAQLYGSSGSVYYTLPASMLPPQEILVTQESRNAPITQPTGPVVLHGP